MVLAGSVLDNNGDLVGLADRGVIPCQRKDSGWRRAVWDVQIQAFSLATVLASTLCMEQTPSACRSFPAAQKWPLCNSVT